MKDYKLLEQLIIRLFEAQDAKYLSFNKSLIPLDKGEKLEFIGVRTPELRKIAKEIFKAGEYESFLRAVPYQYFEEYQLHAFLVSEIKDFETCVSELEFFLPFVNNWATCDQMNPKCFRKNVDKLFNLCKNWINSEKTFSIRFGIKCLMDYFLDEYFFTEVLDLVSSVRSEEYYVNMMISWFFATALAKQWDFAFPYITENRLDSWCTKKTIQKACESFRVSEEHKVLLKAIR